MFHNGNPTVIEADDIATVEATGPVETMTDGRQAIPVLLVINPASGKHYEPGTGPAAIHLTNGVAHRLIGLVESVFHLHPAPAAPAEEAPAAEGEADTGAPSEPTAPAAEAEAPASPAVAEGEPAEADSEAEAPAAEAASE